MNYVLETAYNMMVWTRMDDGEHVRCPCCEEEWHREDVERNSDIIRDHLLFNCDVLASEIKIPVKHQINLMTFFFVPCGPQVESKLYYLAEVYKFYVGKNKPSRSIFMAPLPLNPDQQPQILHPLYTIPPHVLAVTEDRGVDASTVTDEEPQATLKAIKRRYERGINSLREPDNIYCWKNNPPRAEEWKATLANVNEAGNWLIKYEEKLQFTQSKARGSAPASSSSSGEPMLMAKAKWSPEAPTAIRFAETPPWRQQELPPVPPKARPVKKDGPPVPPPPPSSRR